MSCPDSENLQKMYVDKKRRRSPPTCPKTAAVMAETVTCFIQLDSAPFGNQILRIDFGQRTANSTWLG